MTTELGQPATRVAVSGLGIVSALGDAPEPFFAALCAGRSALVPVAHLTEPGRPQLPAAFVSREALPGVGPEESELPWGVRMGLVAARRALADAGRTSPLGDAGLFLNT